VKITRCMNLPPRGQVHSRTIEDDRHVGWFDACCHGHRCKVLKSCVVRIVVENGVFDTRESSTNLCSISL
jgi:hypothetical protein